VPKTNQFEMKVILKVLMFLTGITLLYINKIILINIREYFLGIEDQIVPISIGYLN